MKKYVVKKLYLQVTIPILMNENLNIVSNDKFIGEK